MKELMNFLSNQDNITFLMAVVSFILSTGNILVSTMKSKESYKLEVVDYVYHSESVIQFLVCISNRGDSPLSIVDITVFDTICELYPKMIYGRPENWNFRHTAEFPICVPAHGCQYAYLEFCGENFQADQLVPGSKVTFEIRSTRKRGRKSVSLGDRSRYLRIIR